MRRIVLAAVTVAVAGAIYWVTRGDGGPDPALQAQANRDTYFKAPARQPDFAAAEREPCRDHNPLRNAYFGGLHIHTALSADAWAFDTRVRPDEAYDFAAGGEVRLPPLDEAGSPTRALRNPRPLDFAAVTDHAEYLGEVVLCLDKDSGAYGAMACRGFRGDLTLPVSETLKPLLRMTSLVVSGKQRPASICGEDGAACIERSAGPWEEVQRAAERWYDRSGDCRFTTFVAYEYSLAEKASNLHRNVIFANATVPPLPLGAKEAPRPELLWQWLKEHCVDSGTGCDALAIPHNSNWSSGRMFFPEYGEARTTEERSAAAALRAQMEPLAEVLQVKGDSECRRDLYGVTGSADEYCDFEKLRPPSVPVEDCRDGVGEGGMMLKGCLSRFAYTRYGLIQGLAEQEALGVNPFKYGLIAASDTHNGTGGAVAERDNPGAHGMDGTPEKQLILEYDVPGDIATGSPVRYNPGGLAGVWAEENSREALFAAMQRRETFGTSGPRIVPRFFGGWDLPEDICDQPDLAERGYARGVPMGGDLPARPSGGSAPVFVASALRDPTDDGAPLQRIQIIKGWMDDDGVMHQDIVDIAGGDNGATVDIATCERRGEGWASLCGVWRDPDFDPAKPAVYYARVLENPSCRWSTYQCNRLPVDERPEACGDPTVPKTIQERAWTSPIWFSPADG